MSAVTFEQFRALARKRGWTKDMLAARFRGVLKWTREQDKDTIEDFFERVLTCQYKANHLGSVVIPYRSVLALYYSEIAFQQKESGREKFCPCGCGRRIMGRKRFASKTCKQKEWRQKKVTDHQKSAVLIA